jgi:hypothetical protein
MTSGTSREDCENMTGAVLGAIVSAVVGGVIAAVTIVGIVTSGVNSASDNPGNVNAGVPYGSTQ